MSHNRHNYWRFTTNIMKYTCAEANFFTFASENSKT